MKTKGFLNNIDQLAQEYELTREQTLEAFSKGLISGCKKNCQVKSCQLIFQKEYEEFFLYKQYLIIKQEQKEILNSLNNKKITYITLEEAQKIKKNPKIGEIINIEVNPKDFNFYATKDFKNKFNEELIKQKRQNIYDFFKEYENKLISAKVIDINDNCFILELEREVHVLLLKKETLNNDNFFIGERIQVYVVEVKSTTKMPKILVSRTHNNFVLELFKEFIPEIKEGIVEIINIARFASLRTKISFVSHDNKIDPIGSCIGPKGNRIKNIVAFLKGEKVDLFLWSSDIQELITNALKPANINKIISIDEEQKKVEVLVSKEQVPLVIGKSGINVQLASKVTKWRINIQTQDDDTKDFYQ
ncbi:transcription termination factor NusA [Candidatus Phytoplasma pini]|uniref:Transcription termination/antitermination protein NusA n=1 Tax=Candidatus Phytoplasma pini TaxID=267362 RepID=A0A559KJ31_9MOLU|nr:transcription termination factor NusA [Candidatus Phytoplasma pini]TVY12134.1 Transcription elongation protein nusA [Candidatus Phytoplasma pini]